MYVSVTLVSCVRDHSADEAVLPRTEATMSFAEQLAARAAAKKNRSTAGTPGSPPQARDAAARREGEAPDDDGPGCPEVGRSTRLGEDVVSARPYGRDSSSNSSVLRPRRPLALPREAQGQMTPQTQAARRWQARGLSPRPRGTRSARG